MRGRDPYCSKCCARGLVCIQGRSWGGLGGFPRYGILGIWLHNPEGAAGTHEPILDPTILPGLLELYKLSVRALGNRGVCVFEQS